MRLLRFVGLCKFNWGNKAFALLLLCTAGATTSSAQTFATVFAFNGSNGTGPEFGAVVQGTDGNFYGTTSLGGAHSEGTVFKITPDGHLTTLYSFCARPKCVDGWGPFEGLMPGTDGNFYGTTVIGGANNYGTIFKITTGGKLTVLHSFSLTDGAEPRGALIQAADGNLYGTTSIGGANSYGTIFKITPGDRLTTLYNFCAQTDCADGSAPIAGLVQGTDGNFYGTTGGLDNLHGTVFKITPAGTLTKLYTFCTVLDTTCPHGSYPTATLVQGTDGNFYGTTYYGGSSAFGTIFKITPAGKLTTLHTFVQADGEGPMGGLVEGSDGNFYGTTTVGGLTFSGTIFKITRTGTLTSLYSFYCESLSCPDGSDPYGGLAQGTDGFFYGTTFQGNGTVFSLNEGLNPFVETRPTSGKVGATVTILGTDLTGATSVTFRGTAATFTVVSESEIRATVPTGATSGTVEVTTPSGSLLSNTKFRVTR